jgi:hypothetical protein
MIVYGKISSFVGEPLAVGTHAPLSIPLAMHIKQWNKKLTVFISTPFFRVWD